MISSQTVINLHLNHNFYAFVIFTIVFLPFLVFIWGKLARLVSHNKSRHRPNYSWFFIFLSRRRQWLYIQDVWLCFLETVIGRWQNKEENHRMLSAYFGHNMLLHEKHHMDVLTRLKVRFKWMWFHCCSIIAQQITCISQHYILAFVLLRVLENATVLPLHKGENRSGPNWSISKLPCLAKTHL